MWKKEGSSVLVLCNIYISPSYANISPLYRGIRLKPWCSDGRKPIWMFRNNAGTTDVQACHELEPAGKPESLFTVKQVLNHQERSCPHGHTKSVWSRFGLLKDIIYGWECMYLSLYVYFRSCMDRDDYIQTFRKPQLPIISYMQRNVININGICCLQI